MSRLYVCAPLYDAGPVCQPEAVHLNLMRKKAIL